MILHIDFKTNCEPAYFEFYNKFVSFFHKKKKNSKKNYVIKNLILIFRTHVINDLIAINIFIIIQKIIKRIF